jgi:hypothetical protein
VKSLESLGKESRADLLPLFTEQEQLNRALNNARTRMLEQPKPSFFYGAPGRPETGPAGGG